MVGQHWQRHTNKMTVLQAPTGTLLSYYKDIKQEIVHTLLLEEYGVSKKWVIIMDRRQDSNATSTAAGKIAPSLLCQRFRRRRKETASRWKRRRIETSLVIVKVMLHVLTYVVSYELFWNWIGAARFVSQEVWFDKAFESLLFDTFLFTVWYKLCRCDNSVL